MARRLQAKYVMRRGVPLRCLPALCLGFALIAAGGPALAQLDLTSAWVTMSIPRVAGVGQQFSVELRVQGTGITSATITPPGVGATPVTLLQTGSDFVLTLLFNSQAAFDTGFPDGSYRLTLNGGSRTADIVFKRLEVPSPAISAPVPSQLEQPGPIEVAFSACAICNEAGDSVTAALEQGTTSLATATLTATDQLWTPSDGAIPVELAENSEFTASVSFLAGRDTMLTASGNDTFTFRNRFAQSDELTFETGFAPTQGAFCIVSNDTSPATLDPLGECRGFDALEFALIDTSGSYATVAGGVDVDYDLELLADGTLAGDVLADVDGDGVYETSTQLEGKLRGRGDRLRQRIKFQLGDAPPELKLKIQIADAFSLPDGTQSQQQRTRGVLAGVKIKEKLLSEQSLVHEPLGWRFDFTITDDGQIEDASIQLENGRNFPLEGSAGFDASNGRWHVELAGQGDDAGVSAEIRSLGVDEIDGIFGGKLFYEILGQKGQIQLR
jgi:hypothetical protein